MKTMRKRIWVAVALGVLSAGAQDRIEGLPLGGKETAVLLEVGRGPLVYTVRDTAPGLAVRTEGLFGADLAVWNQPGRYEEVKPYLVEAGFNWFRFPDGSLSNDYHWNGAGRRDETGLWHPDAKTYAPGFLDEALWRGTSKDNYGFRRASHLLDQDSSTAWWGVVDDSLDAPWFVVDMGQEVEAQEVEVLWGQEKPRASSLWAWKGGEAPYPGPHQLHGSRWAKVWSGAVKGEKSLWKFGKHSARYWAVRFAASDLGPEGVKAREFVLRGVEGEPLRGARAWGIGTRAGGVARTDWTGLKWDFETFMAYVRGIPNAAAVICVNVGTGTPEEAAAWVRYANQEKGYAIRDWQIGNENDGDWEEGGPLSARQYAARFLAFARAMKGVDSSIRLHGPLHSTDEFHVKGDGMYSGRSWMESFLAVVGEAERREGRVYLDAVDLHTYPYWTAGVPEARALVRAPLRVAPMFDTLDVWMARHLGGGEKRRVHLSEFSSTVIGTHQTQRAVQATAVSSLFASFVQRFGDRGHALPWDVYGALQKGQDGSYGSLRLFDPAPVGSWSSWGGLRPSAQYFGLYLAFQEWAAEGLRVMPVEGLDEGRVRAFALGSGDSLRVLLANMDTVVQRVELRRSSGRPAPIEVSTFGEREFHWEGEGEDARALPGGGPSGKRLPASSSLVVELPPLGLAVAKWEKAKKPGLPGLWHGNLERSVLRAGATLEAWGSLRSGGGSLKGARWSVEGVGQGEILSADGNWDGSVESFRLRLPLPSSLKPGSYALKLLVKGEKGASEFDLPWRLRGAWRTVQNLDTAEGWYVYAHGNNATRLDWERQKGAWWKGAFFIEQPAAQTYPNFCAAHLGVEPSAWPASSAGLVFDYSLYHLGNQGYAELMLPSTKVKDYDEYVRRLRPTRGQWVRDTVLWNEMAQEGWGAPQGPLDFRTVRELEWRVRGEGKGELRLMNVYLLSEEGKEMPMPAMGPRR